MPSAFDIAVTPLASGRTLIEASAGTGKTYTIAGLVLRLVLESGLTIEQILVSTYTELATAELRERVRTVLRDCLLAFQAGSTADDFLSKIVARHRAQSVEMMDRLESALQNFDAAPVFTIHGFCQRMLQDRAFESGAFFDAELIADQSHILREIADDFWRRNFYDGASIIAAFAQREGFSADRFFRDAEMISNNPTLRVSGSSDTSFDALKGEITAIWEKLRACWASDTAAIRAFLRAKESAEPPRAKPDKMTLLLHDLEACLSDEGSAEQLEFEQFAGGAPHGSKRAGKGSPQQTFSDLCERLLALDGIFASTVTESFFEYARATLPIAKTSRNVFSFDDLLARLHQALLGPRGDQLATMIREKYRAALIDEFQDTDPIQYAIFRRIYDGSDAPVFFIGDPKQAIYSFRGADVFTYLDAASSADRSYMLETNWRSESGLVQAVNTVFGRRSDRAFVLDGIAFEKVAASGTRDKEPLRIDGHAEPPLQVWLAINEDGVTNGAAEELLPAAVAAEIARLLQQNTTIGDRRIEPRDIAILISTNREAPPLQQALSALNIPSVVYAATSVFASPDAIELGRILAAIAEPNREPLLRGALATETLGISGDALDALSQDARGWDARLIAFQRYHELWGKRGFIQMFRAMLRDEGVRPRLLRLIDGERRLTNLIHLGELLHQACSKDRLGMTGLLKWFAQARAGTVGFVEAYEQRLERDDDAVRIVTVHKSKGLEYGIVFCPYAWRDAKLRDLHPVRFHDQENRLTLDLGSADHSKNKASALREDLAERLRHFYVAVTRARHRCYFVWGNLNNGQKSAPAWLLTDADAETFLEGPTKRKTSPAPVQAAANAIRGETILVRDILLEPAAPWSRLTSNSSSPSCRRFSGNIDRSWGITSFSALTAGQEAELPDYDIDEPEPPAEPAAEATGMFAFPRGTAPGTCLHYIFEELDFCDLSLMPDLVRRKLESFSIRGHDSAVCELVQKTLAAPLDPAYPNLTLSKVSRQSRLPELEFYFPIRAVTPQRISRLFNMPLAAEIPQQIGRLQFSPANGFMKGFIDLVFERGGRFYLLDWKSNWLGDRVTAYGPEALAAEMARKHYTLQLHLYTVALHRYLSRRLPDYDYERHFGGAFYIFLRGVDPARPDCGVYRRRPPVELITALSEELESGTTL